MAIKSETREVHDFDEVALHGHGELVLEQGDHEAVVVEADEAVLPRIKTEVEGHRLVLGLRSWWDNLLYPFSPLRFHVTAKTIRGAAISGSGKLQAGPIQTDALRLTISGSGDMQAGPVTANSFEVSISGAGKVIASGRAATAGVHISGSGNVQAGEMESQNADVRISGSGSVAVKAEKTLDVHISGSGSVRYAGQPQVSQHISGSGSVQRLA
jgi:hypothetical protein